MKVLRLLKRSLANRIFLGLALTATAAIVLAVIVFHAVGGAAQRDFRPVHDPVSAEHMAMMKGIPNYLRTEESTYLTFPEWYLVFNPQEYAEFLSRNPPSGFPYFKSIGQFWGGYAQVYGITKRGYPFNMGDHLMEVVIGTSFTVEYVIKGIYENTAGRISEWLGGGAHTEEDAYAAKVAREYGDFIPTRAWYDFPFGQKLGGLWSTTAFLGKYPLRKFERKYFLSTEYGVKAVYAWLIRMASHSVYGLADTEVYTTVKNAPARIFENPDVKKIKDLGDGTCVITVPHYQGFTDTVPSLARQGVQFLDLAGADEILVTVIAPAGWKYDLGEGSELFTMEILTGAGLRRVAVQAPVKSLGAMLREFEARGIRLEHLFDY